jgi:hypothetical protein
VSNNNMDFWEPTLGAMDVIVDCLPPETRRIIARKLQTLARAQENQGLITASYFSRALSGEPAPTPQPMPQTRPRPKLNLVK